MPNRTILLLLLLAPAITKPVAADYPQGLRGKFDLSKPKPLVDAVQLWRLGARYLNGLGSRLDGDLFAPGSTFSAPFRGFDPRTGWFLDNPWLAPAVRFGCHRSIGPGTAFESSLRTALTAARPEVRVQALVLLMRVRSPSTVPDQWRCLRKLMGTQRSALWQALFEDLARAFSTRALCKQIAEPPPTDLYASPPRIYSWSIVAGGVVQRRSLLPRLTTLSRSAQLQTSLDAEHALEMFEGPAGDQALARCIEGWRYTAAHSAARALLGRNRPLLIQTLLKMGVPAGRRYKLGLHLARCDRPG